MSRWYGVCNATAREVFGSFDPSVFMVYFCDENDPENRTVEQLNALSIRYRDAFRDSRRLAAVIKGSAPYCFTIRRKLMPHFEVAVFAAPLSLLHRLNVKVLDAEWEEGQPQLILDDVMAAPDPVAEALEAPAE